MVECEVWHPPMMADFIDKIDFRRNGTDDCSLDYAPAMREPKKIGVAKKFDCGEIVF